MFPKYLFLIFLISILIITAIWDKKENNKFSNTINILLITVVAIISSVIINIVSLSSFGLGRMVFSIGALIGLIFIYLYCTTTIFEKQTNYKYVMITILIIYVIMNILNTLNILISHKQANELDKQVDEIIISDADPWVQRMTVENLQDALGATIIPGDGDVNSAKQADSSIISSTVPGISNKILNKVPNAFNIV